MKRISAIKKVPYLFSILCLALGALMAFQIVWLLKSKRMIEEQFDQRVNLAMGSALTDFNTSHETSLTTDDLTECGLEEGYVCLPSEENFSREDRKALEKDLQSSMSCYGIVETYDVEILDNTCQPKQGAYCCSMDNVDGVDQGTVLGVSFPSRSDYLYDRMTPMIISSVVIFLVLASVSFIILWSLIRQKRITANNIDFFNNTAHELKTPLTNISLALKLLTQKHKELKGNRFAEIIKSENSRLADQIERVLFLSKMENGEYTLEKEELDLKQVLTEVVEAMSLAAQEKNGKIQLHFANGAHPILGDYYHLSNVFRNLIDNALKYCERDPVINIHATETSNHVKVIFSDNGIGISAQDQSHIFEKFQRVNTGNVRQAKGFGIGLSYVKTVIELHKGLVQVKSELNKGSQFQLLIPHT